MLIFANLQKIYATYLRNCIFAKIFQKFFKLRTFAAQ